VDVIPCQHLHAATAAADAHVMITCCDLLVMKASSSSSLGVILIRNRARHHQNDRILIAIPPKKKNFVHGNAVMFFFFSLYNFVLSIYKSTSVHQYIITKSIVLASDRLIGRRALLCRGEMRGGE
jgi:type IV secretory pathway protease TraF